MTSIIIADYDPAWRKLFEEEKTRLLEVIGEYGVDIQHIGSTSVPGLGAKPVIDIQIGVRDLAEIDAYGIEPIVSLGYDYRSEYEAELPFRRYFSKNNAAGKRTHQIHLVEIESDWWERHILFRDYLRAHDSARDAYEQFKRELAPQFTNTNDYAEAKTEFIQAMEVKATTWKKEQAS